METLVIKKDIVLIGIKASSFPQGIEAAHNVIQKYFPQDSNRTYYGISRPEPETIVYRAAVERAALGEGDSLNLEEIILSKGNYISIPIPAYTEQLDKIGEAFNKLLSCPGLDPEGYCVEKYSGENNVVCMIRLEK